MDNLRVWRTVLAALWIVSLLLVAFLGRYTVVAAGGEDVSGYRLDRWTGKTRHLTSGYNAEMEMIERAKP